jgi:hypothetical protein
LRRGQEPSLSGFFSREAWGPEERGKREERKEKREKGRGQRGEDKGKKRETIRFRGLLADSCRRA